MRKNRASNMITAGLLGLVGAGLYTAANAPASGHEKFNQVPIECRVNDYVSELVDENYVSDYFTVLANDGRPVMGDEAVIFFPTMEDEGYSAMELERLVDEAGGPESPAAREVLNKLAPEYERVPQCTYIKP